MLKLSKKILNLNEPIDIIQKDEDILEQLPVYFYIKKKLFKIRLFSSWEYQKFLEHYTAWLINLSAFLKTENIIDNNIINKELIWQKIKNVNFQYLIYQLFKICCYPELYDYEIQIQGMNKIEFELRDNKFKKIMKKIKRKFQFNFKIFLQLNHVQMCNLFFILMIFTVHGYKKKILQTIKGVEKFLRMELPDIWDSLSSQEKRTHLEKGKYGEAVYRNFQK